MTPPLDISLTYLTNFASHYHGSLEFKKELRESYPNEVAAIQHYVVIGGRYCPRVLLACENIIKKMYIKDIYSNYKNQIETRYPDEI